MILNSPFPDFKSEISEEYKLVVADHNSIRKQKRYAHRIMVILHYLFSFGFGCSVYNYNIEFLKSLIWIFIYLILTFLILLLIHQLLRCLIYPSTTWKKNCYIGFYKFVPYCYCKKELNKFRLIIAAIFPFFLLTIVPILIFINGSFYIFLYTIAYSNAIISGFDFYDIYVLIRKVPGWKNPILKSANRYFVVLKKEIKEPSDTLIESTM